MMVPAKNELFKRLAIVRPGSIGAAANTPFEVQKTSAGFRWPPTKRLQASILKADFLLGT
jgi:hypothetical protein